MITREQLHRIIDELPDSELDEAERALTRLSEMAQDPLLRAFLTAQEVDEPLSAEDESAIQEARDQMSRGEGIPLDKLDEYLRRGV